MTVRTPDQPLVVHRAYTILYANQAFLSLIGANSREEVVGTDILDVIAPIDRECLSDQFDRIAKGESSTLGRETELYAGDDRRRDVVTVSSLVEWDGKECIQTIVFDIDGNQTARSLSEHVLTESPVGVAIADDRQEDVPLLYVNDAFVELTGYPREEILGRNCRFLQGPETRQEPVRRMHDAIEAGEACQVTLRNYRKDGSMFWNRVSLKPITDEEGKVTHYIGFHEDVSDKKIYEREKTLFERHAEASSWSMLITDREGRIEYVNPAFERTTGYDAEEVIGRTPRILKSGEQDDEFYDALWKTITSGEIWESAITNRRKSGELYHAHQTIVPIMDDGGDVVHFVAIEPDVTNTEMTEQVLDVMNRVLRHNVRTAVNLIEGYTELLLSQLDDADQRVALRAIQEQATLLEKLSSDTAVIRDLFRNRQTPHTLSVTRIPGFVDSAREKYPNAVIDLTLDLDESTEITNGNLLEIVLEEAIENAVEHSDGQPPRVEITVSMGDHEDHVQIEIADNGPGIPDSEWSVIMAGGETPLLHSSGVGLWLIYWAVTAMGGTIDLLQTQEGGTGLTLELPTGPPAGLR